MKNVKTFDQFLNEAAFDMEAYDTFMRDWSAEFAKFLQGKSLGGLKIQDIKDTYSHGLVEFTVKVDELELNWMIKQDGDNAKKPKVYIGVSSPNKRGAFEKTVTGRNATNQKVFDKITDIYMNAYKYK